MTRIQKAKTKLLLALVLMSLISRVSSNCTGDSLEETCDLRELTNHSSNFLQNQDLLDLLTTFFPKEYVLYLMYNSDVDGDDASVFHKKCDYKFPTLTVIESENGRIFGGFTYIAWTTGNHSTMEDPNAFVFSFDHKKKMPCHRQAFVTYVGTDYFPIFGRGNDIHIANHFTKNRKSYSELGDSYGTQEDWKDIKSYEYLAGTKYFKVKRLEVFYVNFK